MFVHKGHTERQKTVRILQHLDLLYLNDMYESKQWNEEGYKLEKQHFETKKEGKM
jgi:hypothetical protein